MARKKGKRRPRPGETRRGEPVEAAPAPPPGEAAEPQLFVVGTNPDVAVIDISLKGGDGIDLLKRIKAHNGTARLLVWSTYSEGLCAERALRAGTLGYVNKDQATDQIVVAILRVLDGKVYLSDTMAERMLHRAVGGGKPPSAAHRLIRSPTGNWRSFDWSARV